MPSAADIELEFYERFLIAKGLEPYPVQEEAISRIFRGESVLVSVPTGTGKTLMAKAGIHKALCEGKRAIYTTPLRALTEEKFRELCADFGEERVGFATGDYKVRPEAPVQVLVAEILWSRIFGDRVHSPAEIVIMDEGHYFNDPERGYVWEQSIIGLDPRAQLVILSATIGDADQFCHWAYLCRREPLALVQSFDRTVPLYHEFRETYLLDVVRDLFANGECPAIIFTFGREACFERARLLKSCRRFTTDEERATIAAACDQALLDRGIALDLKPLLLHGIGVHHAGILPRYKQLVEKLALERLVKFIVSTETIAAGINLPAKRVVFPELRKYVQKQARLLTSAEYHQMAGRAGRPQFDTEGIAITLAPEEVVRQIRDELKAAQKSHFKVDEARLRKAAYARVRSEAQRANDVSWDPDAHGRIVAGQPAPLTSQTRITAEQVLAIGLPDLTVETLPGAVPAAATTPGEGAPAGATTAGEEAPAAATPGEGAPAAAAAPAPDAAAGATPPSPAASALPSPPPAAEAGAPPPPPPTAFEPDLPVSLHLNIVTVIDHLLLTAPQRAMAHKRLAQVTANLRALEVIDERGAQQQGEIIGKLRGIDGLFVYYALMSRDLAYEDCRALCELLLDHDIIQKKVMRKELEARRQAILARWREQRRDNPQLTFEDVEAEYDAEFPRELTPLEILHGEFLARLPHPELHGGKQAKAIWAAMEDEDLSFLDFVEKHDLAMEEGSLFTYLARVMKIARMLHEATGIGEFHTVEEHVRKRLSAVDERVLDYLF